MSVLNKDEREFVDGYRSWFTSGAERGQPCDGRFIATIDRLVAEVARLRARNEALEKVAKAAAKLDEWDIGKFMTCEDCGHTDQDAKEIDTAYCAMSAALSSLNPSDPNSSGGET